MTYATTEDVQARYMRELSSEEIRICDMLLNDASVIIDAFNIRASDSAKMIVSCNMVIRALSASNVDIPMGATQGTVSGLGYSQTWTMSGGSTGEMYLTKIDKKILGCSGKIGFASPYEEEL